MNGLNTLIKRQKQSDWIKKQDLIRHLQIKTKRIKIYIMQTVTMRVVFILISDYRLSDKKYQG